MIQAVLRGVGEVQKPLYIVLGTVVLNFALDPLLIFGIGPIPATGVAGAALATLGTQSLAAVAGLSLLLSGRYGIHLRPPSALNCGERWPSVEMSGGLAFGEPRR